MKQMPLQGVEYSISEDGLVYNRYGRCLRSYFDKYGYKYVLIRHNGKRKKYLIHRLVAQLYLPNPYNLPQVNHIDGDKGNSHISNLEWITSGNNQLHSRYVLGNITGFADTPVQCVETGKIYKSTREAWRDTDAGYSHISECASGKRKTAGGYHWRYV